MQLLRGDKIELKRQSNNFDFLRLFAAALVLVAHSFYLLNGKHLDPDPLKAIFGKDMGRIGVLIFFIISGFLVTKSWLSKKSVIQFVVARFLRIYPAAIVVILLSVFCLGFLLSSEPFDQFIGHSKTHDYFKNISLFHLYYYLPGVFDDNPHNSVNGSLWTLPYELFCYFSIFAFGLLQILKRKYMALLLGMIFLFVLLLVPTQLDKIVVPFIGIDFKNFYSLFLYFYAGSLFFIWKEHIRFSLFFALLALVVLTVFEYFKIPNYLGLVLIPYIILSVAFTRFIPFNKIGKFGDFSYGIYLYAFPVQQVMIHFFKDKLSTAGLIILSIFFVMFFAYFSWHWIEKPSMNLKKKIFN